MLCCPGCACSLGFHLQESVLTGGVVFFQDELISILFNRTVSVSQKLGYFSVLPNLQVSPAKFNHSSVETELNLPNYLCLFNFGGFSFEKLMVVFTC